MPRSRDPLLERSGALLGGGARWIGQNVRNYVHLGGEIKLVKIRVLWKRSWECDLQCHSETHEYMYVRDAWRTDVTRLQTVLFFSIVLSSVVNCLYVVLFIHASGIYNNISTVYATNLSFWSIFVIRSFTYLDMKSSVAGLSLVKWQTVV